MWRLVQNVNPRWWMTKKRSLPLITKLVMRWLVTSFQTLIQCIKSPLFLVVIPAVLLGSCRQKIAVIKIFMNSRTWWLARWAVVSRKKSSSVKIVSLLVPLQIWNISPSSARIWFCARVSVRRRATKFFQPTKLLTMRFPAVSLILKRPLSLLIRKCVPLRMKLPSARKPSCSPIVKFSIA